MGTRVSFEEAAAPPQGDCAILHSHKWPTSHQHIVALIFAILLGVWWHFVVVLILHFPNALDHLFMCLFAIHISSLVKHLFKPFAYYKIGFSFLLLGCVYKFLARSPLSDIDFSNIFSKCVACLSVSVTVFWKEKVCF